MEDELIMTYRGVKNTFVICGMLAQLLLLWCIYRIFTDIRGMTMQNLKEIEFDIESYSVDDDTDSIEFQIAAYADKVFYVEAYNKFDIDLFEEEAEKIGSCFVWVDGGELNDSNKYVNIYGFQINEKVCLSVESSRRYFMMNIALDCVLAVFCIVVIVFSIYICTGRRYYNIR